MISTAEPATATGNGRNTLNSLYGLDDERDGEEGIQYPNHPSKVEQKEPETNINDTDRAIIHMVDSNGEFRKPCSIFSRDHENVMSYYTVETIQF